MSIAGLLAGKITGIAIFLVACMAPPLLIVCIWLNVELNGLALGSWHLVDGAIHKRDVAIADLKQAQNDINTAHGSIANLKGGIDRCNASVQDLKKKGEVLQADADKAVDAARKLSGTLAANLAAIRAFKPTDEKCAGADELISRGFQ